jgi:uncharacterized protein (TIGR04141 family)
MNDNKKINTSIFLLKEGVSPEEALKEEAREDLKDFEKISGWKIVAKGNPPLAPDWADCLGVDVGVCTASAVLFIKWKDLWFAVCFGHGYNFLDKNEVVVDFGLRTALNALDKDRIKSSDIFSPSDHSKQRRTQTVADSSLQGHDIDGFSHILKRITGKVQGQYGELFKTISASSDSIKISVPKDIDEWVHICSKLHFIYSKDDCEKNFPEVFHLRPVRDMKTEEKLFERLLSEINGRGKRIYLEIPELIDFQETSGFRISVKDRKRHSFNYENLNIEKLYEIVSELGKAVELEDLKNGNSFCLTLTDETGKHSGCLNAWSLSVTLVETGNIIFPMASGTVSIRSFLNNSKRLTTC